MADRVLEKVPDPSNPVEALAAWCRCGGLPTGSRDAGVCDRESRRWTVHAEVSKVDGMQRSDIISADPILAIGTTAS